MKDVHVFLNRIEFESSVKIKTLWTYSYLPRSGRTSSVSTSQGVAIHKKISGWEYYGGRKRKEQNRQDSPPFDLHGTLSHSLSLSWGVSVVSCTCLFFFFFSFLSVCLADVFLIRLFGRRLDINQTLPKYGHRLDNKLENPAQSISQPIKTVQRHALSTPSSFVFGNEWASFDLFIIASPLAANKIIIIIFFFTSFILLLLWGTQNRNGEEQRWGLNGIFQFMSSLN